MDFRKLVFCILLTIGFQYNYAQTPIDNLQKKNLTFLELQESMGFNFRSQIITEFNAENASQNVNLKLSSSYTYEFVAMADDNVKDLDLIIKNTKSGSWIEVEDYKKDDRNTVYIFQPEKDSKYSFTIVADEFNGAGKGFVSFMVLRKPGS